jgi:GNAT superfamily N-acetyltransferase
MAVGAQGVLRPARSTDAGKLGAILTEAVAANTWKPVLHSGAQDVAHLGQMIDRDWVTVAQVESGAVAGFIARSGPEVHALYVTGTAQNGGVGTELLRDAMTREAMLELWTFEVNVGAQKFYARHGFVEVERTDGRGNDERLPDIRYLWTAKEVRA